MVFVIAAASDSLDGYLARRFRQTTVIGAFLDPLADKLLVTAALVSLVELGELSAVGCYGGHSARVSGDGTANGGRGAADGHIGEQVGQGEDGQSDAGHRRSDHRAPVAQAGVDSLGSERHLVPGTG